MVGSLLTAALALVAWLTHQAFTKPFLYLRVLGRLFGWALGIGTLLFAGAAVGSILPPKDWILWGCGTIAVLALLFFGLWFLAIHMAEYQRKHGRKK